MDFDDGVSFQINMDEIEVMGELGRGNYGSVQQVFHRPTEVEMAMKVSTEKAVVGVSSRTGNSVGA